MFLTATFTAHPNVMSDRPPVCAGRRAFATMRTASTFATAAPVSVSA
jgi:hypothetical protein